MPPLFFHPFSGCKESEITIFPLWTTLALCRLRKMKPFLYCMKKVYRTCSNEVCRIVAEEKRFFFGILSGIAYHGEYDVLTRFKVLSLRRR